MDGVSTSPAIRLELNDEAPFAVARFTHSPAPLTRTLVSNLMRDGGHSGPSARGLGSLVLDIDLITDDQDTNAEWLQRLARELDRESNWIEYQPQGATYPVFFKTYRAPFATIADVVGAAAFRQISVEIPCDPYALGTRQSVAAFTVNNDPASGTNGCYFDVTGVKGDALTPMLLTDSDHPGVASTRRLYVGVRQSGSPASMQHFFQAESASLATDTTNPGGGPDAAMSGTGTNNFVRCSFATVATMEGRLTLTPTASAEAAGRYRLLGVVRRSSGTGIIKMRYVTATTQGTLATGDTVTTAADTNRNLIDLGIVNLVAPTSGAARSGVVISIQASRETGTSTLDFDCFHLVPADAASTIVDVQYRTTGSVVLDSLGDEGDALYWVDNSANLFGTASAGYLSDPTKQDFVGAFPWIMPDITNRVVWVKVFGSAVTKTDTSSVAYYYYPRYEHVRPLGS